MTHLQKLLDLLVSAGVQYEELPGSAFHEVRVHVHPVGVMERVAIWIFDLDGNLVTLSYP